MRLKDNVVHNPLYFSRNYGLFLVCFPDAVPSGICLYHGIVKPTICVPSVFLDIYLRIKYLFALSATCVISSISNAVRD